MVNLKRLLAVSLCLISTTAVVLMSGCKVTNPQDTNNSLEETGEEETGDAGEGSSEEGVVVNQEYNEDAPEHLDMTVQVGDSAISLKSTVQDVYDAGLKEMASAIDPIESQCSAILGFTDSTEQETKELSVGFFNTTDEEKQPQETEIFYLSVPMKIEQFIDYDEETDTANTNTIDNGVTIENISVDTSLDDLVSTFGDYYSTYHDDVLNTDVYEWNNHDMTEHMQVSISEEDNTIVNVSFTKDVIVTQE